MGSLVLRLERGRLEVIQAFQEELAQHDGREDFLLDAVMIATENDRRAVLHYLVKELVPRWIPKPGRQQKLVDSGLEGVAGGTSLKRAKHFLASIPATLYSAELIFRKLQWAPNPEVFYFLLDQVDLAGFDNNFLLYIVLVTRARYTPHYFGAILAKLAQIPDGLSRVDSQRLLDELTYPGFGFEADDPCLAESRAIWKIYFG